MSDPVSIVLETAAGTIVIDVHTAAAPQTARYVLDLVDAGCFRGATFYRSTHFGIDGRRPLIQGGPLAPLFTGSGATIPEVELLDTVETTSLTGLRHRRGTVSLARDLFSTGNVLPELFICLDDYPELDAGGRSEPDSQGRRSRGRRNDRRPSNRRSQSGEPAGRRSPHQPGSDPQCHPPAPPHRKQHLT
jgi:peptidyl-prolyl cis-trans isomerase A (cyclophilin A)